ncbi:hypothetical protein ACOJIV_24520 [Haloarcula sp. AONF1]
MPDAVDEAAVRDALEAAYQRKADADPSAIELYAYASDLPAGVDAERARSIAKDVIRDPPAAKAAEPAFSGWEEADFGDTTPGVYPSDHRDRASWMVQNAGKMAYAPWSSTDEPAPCSEHNTTADKCDCDARWKWGHAPNRRPFEKAKLALDDPRFDGLAFIQTEDDPFVFVDGDDVRDPETGAVHPAFRAVLEHLGPTYADVSTSGTGVHAYYRGALPGDETAPSWPLDDEPFGANDDLPEIELYSGKHVCIATGEHVSGTPTGARRWNGEVLRPLLKANGELDDETPSTETRNTSTRSSTGGGSDPTDALNRLDARDVAEKTIVDEWTDTSGDLHAFHPTWGTGDPGTANIVGDDLWTDTGTKDGHGGPIQMAMIDLGELHHENSEPGCVTGADFWTAYEHLRDLGFNLPEPEETDSEQKSDYYDLRLGEYVDGDPWSDPDAMLAACLLARSEGAVSRDADPPTLALTPIVREYLGTDEVGAETRDMAAEVYLNELSAAEHVDGRELCL